MFVPFEAAELQSRGAVLSLPRWQAEQAETSLSTVFEDFIAQDEMHPNETGRLEARNVAVGRNQKKCSRCQPQQLRRAITSLPQSEESSPSPCKRGMSFHQHLTLLQVFRDNGQVFLLSSPQDNQPWKQNSSSYYFHFLLFVKTEVPKVSF